MNDVMLSAADTVDYVTPFPAPLCYGPNRYFTQESVWRAQKSLLQTHRTPREVSPRPPRKRQDVNNQGSRPYSGKNIGTKYTQTCRICGMTFPGARNSTVCKRPTCQHEARLISWRTYGKKRRANTCASTTPKTARASAITRAHAQLKGESAFLATPSGRSTSPSMVAT